MKFFNIALLVAVVAGVQLEKGCKGGKPKRISDEEMKEFANEIGLDVSKFPITGEAATQLIADAKEEGINVDKNGDGNVGKGELKAGMSEYLAKMEKEDAEADSSDAEADASDAAADTTAATTPAATTTAATTTAAAQVEQHMGITNKMLAKAGKQLGIDISSLPLKGAAATKLMADAAGEGIDLDTDKNGKISRKELKAGLAAYLAKNPGALDEAPASCDTSADTAATPTAAAQTEQHMGITDKMLRKAGKQLGIDISSLPLKGAAATKLTTDAAGEGIDLDTDKNGKITKKELKAGLAAYLAKNPGALDEAPASCDTAAPTTA